MQRGEKEGENEKVWTKMINKYRGGGEYAEGKMWGEQKTKNKIAREMLGKGEI
jgi:hypothetical protein